jgi:hypothetical protein
MAHAVGVQHFIDQFMDKHQAKASGVRPDLTVDDVFTCNMGVVNLHMLTGNDDGYTANDAC